MAYHNTCLQKVRKTTKILVMITGTCQHSNWLPLSEHNLTLRQYKLAPTWRPITSKLLKVFIWNIFRYRGYLRKIKLGLFVRKGIQYTCCLFVYSFCQTQNVSAEMNAKINEKLQIPTETIWKLLQCTWRLLPFGMRCHLDSSGRTSMQQLDSPDSTNIPTRYTVYEMMLLMLDWW